MGISVNARSCGARRMSAFARIRLMEVDERLPTKYPTLYPAMVAPFFETVAAGYSVRRRPRPGNPIALDARTCFRRARTRAAAAGSGRHLFTWTIERLSTRTRRP